MDEVAEELSEAMNAMYLDVLTRIAEVSQKLDEATS
jgi:hypothetical protein